MATRIFSSDFGTDNCSPKSRPGFGAIPASGPIGFDLANGRFTNFHWHGLLLTLKADYPAVDIDAAVNRAAIWLIANPSKRPVGDHARFLTSWFGHQQKRIGAQPVELH
jgi:hypothetical protein